MIEGVGFMRGIVTFFNRTAIGGVFFLLPLALVIFLAGQLVVVLRPVAAEVAGFLGGFALGPFWLGAAVIVTLVVLAFVAGLAATTFVGRRLAERLEVFALNQVPGYSIVKSAAADAASSMAEIDRSERKKAVLIATDGMWQIGFVTDEVGEDLLAVFIPDAPSPEAGALVYVARDRVVDSGLSVSDALACLRRLGARTPALPTALIARELNPE
jgi:uncharacterized membrane protein